MTLLKDLPELARDGSNLNAVIATYREAIQTFRGYRGDPLDKAMTLRDATNKGLLTTSGAAAVGLNGATGPVGAPGASGVVIPDLTPPPTATGLSVTAGITSLYVSCDAALYTQGHGHDRSIVYGAKWPIGDAAPTFGNAVELFQFQGTFSAYTSDPSTRWCLWIKWRSNDSVLSVSPAGGTNGVQATTGLNVSTLVSAMTGTGNPFTILATDAVIDGVTYLAGTYTTRALIMDAQISSAKIKALAVDDGKIANLSAAKLTVGDGTVGGNLKSTVFTSGSAGWLIQPNGSAEFNTVTVRGTVYATAGLIGGNTINASGLQSPGYSAGLTGWRLDTSGDLKAYNGAGANQFDLTASGITPVLKIGTALSILGNGTATFGGALSAATGTFAGTLTASAVNAVNTINLAGYSVTVPLSVVAYPNTTHNAATLSLDLVASSYQTLPADSVIVAIVTLQGLASAASSVLFRARARAVNTMGVSIQLFDASSSVAGDSRGAPAFSGSIIIPSDGVWKIVLDIGNGFEFGSWTCQQASITAFGAKR